MVHPFLPEMSLHVYNFKTDHSDQQEQGRYARSEIRRRLWACAFSWARDGVVMVLDVADTYMSPHHPYRQAWRSLAAKRGLECRDFTGYVNSGCVGINRVYKEFAVVWSALMEELEPARICEK